MPQPGKPQSGIPQPGNQRLTASPESRRAVGVPFADRYQLTLVLKGRGTLVTDGRRVYVNSTGNPGMATGGSGDVLTGVILALLGQGLSPFDAAQLGTYVHGLAGDLAAEDLGQFGLIASDLPRYLAAALRQVSERGC